MADAKGPVFNPISDLRAIVFIFVILWVFWFAIGGPAKYEESQKPFLETPTTSLDEQNIWRDPFISEQYGSIPTTQIRGSGSTTTATIPKVESSMNYKLFAKPTIYLTRGQTDSSGKGYLKIDFPASNDASLNITGLSIRDIFNKGIVIGKASSLPYQGRINEEMDIIVSPGSSIFFIEGLSPIGVSFRINKCIGYLAHFQKFYPPLHSDIDQSYPPSRERYGGASAGQFPQDQTYNNCVDKYKDDSDFYDNDWRIYLGNKSKFWRETGGLLRLMDKNNRQLARMFY